MAAFTAGSCRAPDGTELAYRTAGEPGEPVICVPGGPMRDSDYLGDLGGLAQDVALVLLDLRGTGKSAVPADPASYRCDRQTEDVTALADHLGLRTVRLLAHSAGANIAVHFAVAHPDRVDRLALITPSTRSVGIEATSDQRREVVTARRAEPWFAGAAAAFERIQADGGTEADWEAIQPFVYGRWDAAAQEHSAQDALRSHADAERAFNAAGAFDPPATRAGLSRFTAPVLVLAGEVDIADPPEVMAEYAALFPAARFVLQPGAGHFPWLDDPASFRATVSSFLAAG
jgi:proline iminopeptidase